MHAVARLLSVLHCLSCILQCASEYRSDPSRLSTSMSEMVINFLLRMAFVRCVSCAYLALGLECPAANGGWVGRGKRRNPLSVSIFSQLRPARQR